MLRSNRLRRGLLPLALAALLLAPAAARAEDPSDPTTGATPVGVAFAMVCGASLSIVKMLPVPIVGAVAAFSCAVMLMDAMATPDP